MGHEQISLGGCPVVGFGAETAVAPPTSKGPSPWTVAIATSVLSTATGWAIEEIARRARGGRR